MPIVKRICLQCKKEFSWKATPSNIRAGWGKFCSRACRYKAQIKKIERNCLVCGGKFTRKPSEIKRGVGKYCSQKCYSKARKTGTIKRCSICGKEFYVVAHEIKKGRKYCSVKCRGKGHTGSGNPYWKGGRKENSNGYIEILLSPTHKFHYMCKKTNYVAEHRLVMAEELNRCLKPWETVHHKNGIRDDNRIENLELKISNHGGGSTVPDQIIWAKAILSTYGVNEKKYQ